MIMRNTAFVLFFLLSLANGAWGGDTLSIRDITSGNYAAENLRSLAPLADGECFAQVSSQHDKILKYRFDTGLQTGVIFDVAETQGASIQSLDNYKTSPDDRFILVGTKSNRIYRRSFTADYYIYNVENRQLTPLSQNGAQQSPIWSPDSRKVAFVRDNNIFVVNIDEGMKETQVTTDGKFNEVINGIPDWVNEEEFGLSTSMAFTHDSQHLCWIRYDETAVKTYALQLFKGLAPEKQENADYPGRYAYKYPKAGQDNAVVSAWCHDLTSHATRQLPLPLPHEGYIPRIFTGKTAGDVLLYTMNRHQDSLMVYRADAASQSCRLLFTETVPKYVKEEVLSNISFTKNGRYGVTQVYGYDDKTGKLYFQAAGQSPLEREVYVADKRGKTSCLTPRKGWNSAVFSADYNYYIATWSDMNTPFECDVFDIKGRKLRSVVDNAGLLTESQRNDLSNKLDNISSKYGVDVVIYTDTTTPGTSVRWARAASTTSISRNRDSSSCAPTAGAQAAEGRSLRNAPICNWVNWRRATRWRRRSISPVFPTLTASASASGDGATADSAR